MNKVILVGPSKSLLKDKLGEKIDSFDVVCRMNWHGAPDLINEKNKSIIGTKKNIWFCKHVACFNLFPVHGYDKLIGFAQFPSERINQLSDIIKKASAKGAKTLDKCINTLKEFNNNISRPSCGILSIFYLLDKYDKIYICGMDGFKGGHWFGNKFLSNQEESDKMAARVIGAHNAIKEQEYIQYLIQDGKIIKLDE